jgi:hypothetical protein
MAVRFCPFRFCRKIHYLTIDSFSQLNLELFMDGLPEITAVQRITTSDRAD